MSWFNALLLFLMIWWLALFAVLPLGVRPNPEADVVTGWRGAPLSVRLRRVAGITTLVAVVVWGLCYAVIASDWMSFRSGWLAMP
jgi:predicted secreted protein